MKKSLFTPIRYAVACAVFYALSFSGISCAALAQHEWTQEWQGRFRNMEVDYFRTPVRKVAKNELVVIAPGIIENSKWYNNPESAQPLTEFFAAEGFDVLALSFPPLDSDSVRKSKFADASFREILGHHLPSVASMIKEKGWTKVHWVGHSCGATLVAAYLLGYEAKNIGTETEFVINPALSKQRQAEASSFITISGLFKLYWPVNYWDFWNPINYAKHNWFKASPLIQYALERAPLKLVSALKPVIGFNWLSEAIKMGLPFVAPEWLPLREYTVMLNPIFYPPNTTEESVEYVMENALSAESLETISTISSLYYHQERIQWPSSHALKNFTNDLKQLKVPTLFAVGDRDLVTHPEGVKLFGYDVSGATDKTFALIPESGHEDIIISKHPEKLAGVLKQWFSRK